MWALPFIPPPGLEEAAGYLGAKSDVCKGDFQETGVTGGREEGLVASLPISHLLLTLQEPLPSRQLGCWAPLAGAIPSPRLAGCFLLTQPGSQGRGNRSFPGPDTHPGGCQQRPKTPGSL